MKFYKTTYRIEDAETGKRLGIAEMDKGALQLFVADCPSLLYWDDDEERDEWVSEHFGGRPVRLVAINRVEYEPRKIVPMILTPEEEAEDERIIKELEARGL
jgi:hypothetical protein